MAARFVPGAAHACRAAACAAAVLLAACSSMPSVNPLNWFGGSDSGAKPAELPPLTHPQAVRLLWSANVGGAGAFILSPTLAGDSVYAASREGTVVRLDAATGKQHWRVALARGAISGAVGSDDRLAVVATDKGEVITLDAASGAERWRARVSSEVLAAPLVAAGLVLVRSADSRIFAFGAEDGKRRWVYQRASSALIVRSPAGMTVGVDTVYAGFAGGKLVAIALSNGGARWEATVALPKGATELERVTDIAGEPAVMGNEVCAAAFQGRIACYDLRNGNQLWARDLSTLTGASVDARFAYASDDKGAVHAYERASGRSVWKQDKLAHRRLTMPLPLESAVAAGDFQGQVHFMARDSGAFIARFATDGSAIRAAPVRLPGGLLVQTLNGGLYALSL